MKDTFSHLHRSATDHDEAAVRDAIVILDTNVLLDFYRRTEKAREARFDVLEKVGDRLRVPFQVGIEFHRRRVEVAKGLTDAYDKARDAVDGMEAALKGFGGSHYRDTQKDVAESAASGAKIMRDRLARIESNDPHAIDLSNDPLLPRIEELFDGRVLKTPSARKVRKRVERFAGYRLPNQIPPGYADGSKVTMLSAAGDYLIWSEILAFAKNDKRPVLFVTNDMKSDWWQDGSRGNPNQARPELLAEFAERSDADYHQMTVETFLRKAKAHLSVAVPDEVFMEEAAAEAEQERGRIWGASSFPVSAGVLNPLPALQQELDHILTRQAWALSTLAHLQNERRHADADDHLKAPDRLAQIRAGQIRSLQTELAAGDHRIADLQASIARIQEWQRPARSTSEILDYILSLPQNQNFATGDEEGSEEGNGPGEASV